MQKLRLWTHPTVTSGPLTPAYSARSVMRLVECGGIRAATVPDDDMAARAE